MHFATDISTFTCICCPLGCVLEVSFAQDATVLEVEGNTCKRGYDYAVQEATNPSRMVTAVVNVDGCLEPVSVKTAAPVPKKQLSEVLSAIRSLRLAGPVACGEVVLTNVCNTGVDVIATKSVG